MADEKTESKPDKSSKPKTPKEARLEYLATLRAGNKLPVSELSAGAPAHVLAAASSLHCWEQYAHATGHEMFLTREQFDAAIKAASSRKSGKYEPHPAALYKTSKD